MKDFEMCGTHSLRLHVQENVSWSSHVKCYNYGYTTNSSTPDINNNVFSLKEDILQFSIVLEGVVS